MFKDPEKHLLIALTKNRMVSLQFDYDEILDVAMGGNNENISFRGYDVI